MAQEPWTFRFIGGWSATSPGGVPLALTSRKAKALLAMLVLNRGEPLGRTFLAEQLWPNTPKPKCDQNLRRALSDIRRAAAPDRLIESDGGVCWLSGPVACDVLDPALRGSVNGTVLPGMPETYFAPYRLLLEPSEEAGPWHHAASNLEGLLEWIRFLDPSRLLTVLYEARELMPYLPLSALKHALADGLAAAPDHAQRLWAQVELVIATMWQGAGEDGLTQARLALEQMEPEANVTAWASAVAAAAGMLVFRGRFGKAEALLTVALEANAARRHREATDRLHHTLAHCCGYQARLPECRALLRSLDDTLVDAATQCIRNTHRAAYAMLDEDLQGAQDFLALARSTLPPEPDLRLEFQIRLIEAYLDLITGHIERAKTSFIAIARELPRLSSPLMEIHALEGLAYAGPDESERSVHGARALELRRQHHLPVLPLDEVRFRMLASARP